jgi:glutamate dehydrogenase/leucine dehydrogenase
VPDFIANAGGALQVILAESQGLDQEAVDARVRGIGDTVARVLSDAGEGLMTPLASARALAQERLAAAAA